MKKLLQHQQWRSVFPTHGTRSVAITLTSRQFSTTPKLGLISAARSRQAVTRPSRIQDARTFWWSSKPAAGTESAAPQPLSAQSMTSSSSDVGTSAAVQHTASTPSAADTLAAVPSEPISATANVSNATIDTLGASEGFAVVASEAAKLASNDYSHLFSWGWPSGVFLRATSWFQHMEWLQALELGTPVVCLTLAVILFRIPIIPLQWRSLKAQARFAPYQAEWPELMRKIQQAKLEEDQIKLYEGVARMQEIRRVSNMKPFAGLPPVFLFMYTGIGAFLGAGKLAQYHREVIELGGTGPLTYPGGLFGTGFLEDLTTFSPTLLVLLTATTWINTRRSALDSPIETKWLKRMPSLITPIAGVLGLVIQFSAAQLLVTWIGVVLHLAHSYVRRIPVVKRLAGLEKVPVQNPKTYEFEPFISAWRNSYKDAMTALKERAEQQAQTAIRDMERRRVRTSNNVKPLPTSNQATSAKRDFTEQPKASTSANLYTYTSQPPPRPLSPNTRKAATKNANKGKSISTLSRREFYTLSRDYRSTF